MFIANDKPNFYIKLSNEFFIFDTFGTKSFEMLNSLVNKTYAKLNLAKLILLDCFNLFDCFFSSNNILDGLPSNFYTIDIQTIQKNVSTSKEARFEKNFCDLAFLKINNSLELPLILGRIVFEIKQFYEQLNIPFYVKIFKNNININFSDEFLNFLIDVCKKNNISYFESDNFDINDFINVKFYTKIDNLNDYQLGFIIFDQSKILFSLTNGLERIIKLKILNNISLPFIINPLQLVIITNKIDLNIKNLIETIDLIEKKGYAVVWYDLNIQEKLIEKDYMELLNTLKNANAHYILIIPNFSDYQNVILYHQNKKICGMNFFQVNTTYFQNDFK